MKKVVLVLVVLVAIAATGMALAGPIVSQNPSARPCVSLNCCIGPDCVTPTDPPVAAVSLHDSMRELWVDHNGWSRMTLVGIFGSMKGCEFYEDRVQQNVKEVHALLVPYYGVGADKFRALLEKNIEIENEILYSMKSGDLTFKSLIPDWYRNAQEISDLLYSLNPKVWDRDQLTKMWSAHIDASLEQAFAYEKGDSQSEINAFDTLQANSMKMADYLSDGIRQQFPKK